MSQILLRIIFRTLRIRLEQRLNLSIKMMRPFQELQQSKIQVDD